MKPNRVHKATGLIAKFNIGTAFYTLYERGYKLMSNLPEGIVEGEGWENEKSEIDELMLEISNRMIHFPKKRSVDYNSIACRILEFAKNYKEQEK